MDAEKPLYVTEKERDMSWPHKAENKSLQDTGTVQCRAAEAGGSIGVYAFDANEAKEAGHKISITLFGVRKTHAGGAEKTGKKAVLAPSGTFVAQ
jgi:hypothetical protein